MRLITTLSLLLLVGPLSWADSHTELNKKIRQAGAQWTAGTTSVSTLSKREFQAMLDPSLDPHPEVQFEEPEGFKSMASAITTWDWRNKDGKNWMSPIRNQNSCGSCLAFAAVATVESQYRIAQAKSSASIKLSPQFIFSCGGGKCKKGWYPDQAAQFLKTTGAPDESCMPYASSSGADVSCKKACSDSAKRSVKIASYSRPTSNARSLDALRAALKKGPLVTTMSVYGDFMNYRRGIYKHVSGAYSGGHAITLIGYNDKERYLIIRNSWGTTWGESGYGRISYDDTSGIGASTWKYEVTAPKVFDLPLLNARFESLEADPTEELRKPAVANSEPDFDLTPALTTQSNGNTYELLLENRNGEFSGPVKFHQVFKGQEKVVEISMTSSQLKIRVNTTLLKEGDWEFYVTAQDSSGRTVKTQKQVITIQP